MLTLESPAPPTEAVLILSRSRSACLPTPGPGAWLEATEAAEDPGLLASAPARRAPLPIGTWEEVVDCIEVSTAELAASEGAWLVSAEDSPGFLFFLMAASSAAPLPPTNNSN